MTRHELLVERVGHDAWVFCPTPSHLDITLVLQSLIERREQRGAVKYRRRDMDDEALAMLVCWVIGNGASRRWFYPGGNEEDARAREHLGFQHTFVQHRWKRAAACQDDYTETFFPVRGEGSSVALRSCRRCPVAADCLLSELLCGDRQNGHGMWGGMGPRERSRVLQAVNRALAGKWVASFPASGELDVTPVFAYVSNGQPGYRTPLLSSKVDEPSRAWTQYAVPVPAEPLALTRVQVLEQRRVA